MKAALLLLLLALATSGSIAAPLPLASAKKKCEHFPISGFEPALARMGSLEADLPRHIRALQEFKNVTCPEYLKHPNDAAAITPFRRRMDKLFPETLRLSRESASLQDFLEQGHDDMNQLLQGTGIFFTDFQCGTFFWKQRNEIFRMRQQLEKQIDAIKRSCSAANFPNPKELSPLARGTRKAEKGNPVGKKPEPRHSSDVTGSPDPRDKL